MGVPNPENTSKQTHAEAYRGSIVACERQPSQCVSRQSHVMSGPARVGEPQHLLRLRSQRTTAIPRAAPVSSNMGKPVSVRSHHPRSALLAETGFAWGSVDPAFASPE